MSLRDEVQRWDKLAGNICVKRGVTLIGTDMTRVHKKARVRLNTRTNHSDTVLLGVQEKGVPVSQALELAE